MSKKLKEPKTFDRPRAYMRVTSNCKYYIVGSERIRIIYPDGRAEFTTAISYNDWITPCWSINIYNPVELVKSMMRYDEKCGYETIYLGEF